MSAFGQYVAHLSTDSEMVIAFACMHILTHEYEYYQGTVN